MLCTRLTLTMQILLCLRNHIYSIAETPPRVAVVGGGIGGATASYYLQELFGISGSKIDIYEWKKVGGRLALVEVGGRNYEAGGSAIHDKHRYMSNFAKILGLKRATKPVTGRKGIYDGRRYVFKESDYKLWTYLELFVRYGFSVNHWEELVTQILESFDRIYEKQEEGHSYTSVERLLETMNSKFVTLTTYTAEFVLNALKFNDKFINEMGLALTRLRYGQTTQVNGLAGCLSLTAGLRDEWSVERGNYLLATGAIHLADAAVLSSKAKKIILKDDGRYEIETNVKHVDPHNTTYVHRQTYDIVIIAAPQTVDTASVVLQNFPASVGNFSGRYHKTIATFVEGKLNYSYFHFSDESDLVEDTITIDTAMLYNSISIIFPVDWSEAADKELMPVYKIISAQVLNDRTLGEMFESRTTTKVVEWFAYPQYTPPENLGSFQLHDRLYYTSAIEWAGSSMEMNAIAARNVALLAYNRWKGRRSMIDDGLEDLTKPRDEL